MWYKKPNTHYCYVKSKDIGNKEYRIMDVMEPSGEINYYKYFKDDELLDVDKRIIKTYD